MVCNKLASVLEVSLRVCILIQLVCGTAVVNKTHHFNVSKTGFSVHSWNSTAVRIHLNVTSLLPGNLGVTSVHSKTLVGTKVFRGNQSRLSTSTESHRRLWSISSRIEKEWSSFNSSAKESWNRTSTNRLFPTSSGQTNRFNSTRFSSMSSRLRSIYKVMTMEQSSILKTLTIIQSSYFSWSSPLRYSTSVLVPSLLLSLTSVVSTQEIQTTKIVKATTTQSSKKKVMMKSSFSTPTTTKTKMTESSSPSMNSKTVLKNQVSSVSPSKTSTMTMMRMSSMVPTVKTTSRTQRTTLATRRPTQLPTRRQLASLKQANGTYETNCDHRIIIYKFLTEELVKFPDEPLNGKELIMITLGRWRTFIRYLRGDLTPVGVVHNGGYAGYLRTERAAGFNSNRFLFIPQIIQNRDCYVKRVNHQITGHVMMKPGTYRSWRSFLQIEGNKKYISYEDVNFVTDIGKPNLFKLQVMRPTRYLFKHINDIGFGRSDTVLKLMRLINGLSRRKRELVLTGECFDDSCIRPSIRPMERRKRAGPTERQIRTHGITLPPVQATTSRPVTSNYRSIKLATQRQCTSRWLKGTKYTTVLNSVLYEPSRQRDIWQKVFKICKDIIEGMSCYNLEKNYPGWVSCQLSATDCGLTFGDYGAGFGDFTAIQGKLADMTANKIGSRQTECAAAYLNEGITKLEAQIRKVQLSTAKERKMILDDLTTMNKVVQRFLERNKHDMLAISQAINNTRKNIIKVNNETEWIRNQTTQNSAALYNLTGIVGDLTKNVQYLKDVNLKLLTDRVNDLVVFAKLVSKILHLDYHFLPNDTDKLEHKSLDHVFDRLKVLNDNLEKRMAEQKEHHGANITFNKFGISNNSDLLDKLKDQSNNLKDRINTTQDLIDEYQKQYNDSLNEYKKSQERRNKKNDQVLDNLRNEPPFHKSWSPGDWSSGTKLGVGLAGAGMFSGLLICICIVCILMRR